jgi:hypothetical protein
MRAALTEADIGELQQYGISPPAIAKGAAAEGAAITSNTRPCSPKNSKHGSTCFRGSDSRREVAPAD